MVLLSHSGNAPDTVLAGDITDTSNTIVLSSADGLPDGSLGQFYLALDPDTSNVEKILVATRVSNTCTVSAGGRGVDGTSATDHKAGAVVRHVFTAQEAADVNTHINASQQVHALKSGSAVVGTDDTQTLNHKTLNAPAVQDFTNARHDHNANAGGGNVPQSAVTGLGSTLGGLSASISTLTTGKAALSHTHAEADVTGLVAALAALQFSPWTTITLASGFTARTPCQLRTVGNLGYVRGSVQKTDGSDFAAGSAPNLATLTIHPLNEDDLAEATQWRADNTARVVLDSTGVLSAQIVGAVTWVSIQMWFFTD